MHGPGIFLAQFMGDAAPFDTLDSAARWMAEAGYEGVQIPTWDARRIDLKLAAESQDYCDDLAGRCAEAGSRSPNCRPICKASWSRSTPPMTPRSMASRPMRCGGVRQSARLGRSSNSIMLPRPAGGWV